LISPIFRYIVFYFIAMELIKKDNVKKYLNTLLAGNLLVISYGIYVDYFTGNDFFYRANGMGTLASFIVILFLSLLLSKEFGIYKRLALILGIIGGTINLITTYSRGAILGFFVAVIVGIGCIIWRSFKKRSTRKVKVFLISILVFIILAAPFLTSDMVIKRFERIKNINANNSLRTRVAMWKSSLLMIKDNPLLGVGVGNFRSNFIYYLKSKLKIEVSRVGIDHEHPHNLFLYIGAEQGIISLIILLILFVEGYNLGVNNYIKSNQGTLIGLLGLALVGIITTLAIHSLVDTTARYGHVGFYVLLIAVLNLKLANLQEGTGR